MLEYQLLAYYYQFNKNILNKNALLELFFYSFLDQVKNE